MNTSYKQKLDIQQSASFLFMKKLAQWMDRYYLDPLIGLIPGIGDVTTALLSLPLIYLCIVQIRSLPLTLAVIYNMLTDVVLGMLPFGVGAVLDFVNRSFIQNCRMITRYVENDRKTVAAVRRKAVWMALAIVVLCALIYLLTLWIGQLMQWFIGLFQ